MANAAPAARGARITRPAVLKPGHVLDAFDCGRDQINSWLKTRAHRAAESDTARTFVVCRSPKRVIGYYSLAAGAVAHASSVPGALSRNTPDPIPVIILARLGVDRTAQGHGLGQDLLADAMKRSLQAARIVGARALLIHALDPSAAKFYQQRNFSRLKAPEETTFFVTMRAIRDSLA